MKGPTTIVGAIAKVLRSSGGAMSPREIYDAIVREQLYAFKAVDAAQVVKTQLRRHTKELQFPSAESAKYFSIDRQGRFSLLDKPVRVGPSLYRVRRSPAAGRGRDAVVSVPVDDEEEGVDHEGTGVSHTEIQYRLLDLGSKMGYSVWAPLVDRGKEWNGQRIRDVPRMLARLPLNLDVPTVKTIEYIDVLWIEGRTIIAGFEVEHTSSIFSGLLRMADLVTMQPNIDIRFYLVAPDSRAAKFARELVRPTFSSLRKPLHSLCRFLPYSVLVERLEQVKSVLNHLKPEFLEDIAEAYDPDQEYNEGGDRVDRRKR